MAIVATIPMNTTIRHLMENAWSLCLLLGRHRLSGFPFDLPLAPLGGSFWGIFGFWGAYSGCCRGFGQEMPWLELLESLLSVSLLSSLVRRDCSMDRTFTSSRSSTKNSLQPSPKIVELTHGGVIWGSFKTHQSLSPNDGRSEACETGIHLAFFDWATAHSGSGSGPS